MRLRRLRLKNFRCYQEEFTIDFNQLTLIVGKNDAGKSTILDALNIFFGEGKLDKDDLCVFSSGKDIEIICEFDNIPTEIIIDSDFPTSLSEEYLLNGDQRLEIHQIFNGAAAIPKQTGIYIHAVHPTRKLMDDLLLLTNTELKQRAKELSVNLDDTDRKVNSQIRKRIWESTTDLYLENKLIQIDKQKKIWDQIKSYLPVFALFKSDRSSTDQDSEAQDPMKTAIKEALKDQEKELKEITRNVEQQVIEIATKTVQKLREMDESLATGLKPVISPPKWDGIFKVSLTDEDEIPINKRGSGVRRLLLLNFFRAKADTIRESNEKSEAIYAIEEPETSQHPSNQVMLLNAFKEISENSNTQLIITTHTPVLARLVACEDLRYIMTGGQTHVLLQGNDDTYGSIAKALGVLPDHDVKLFIGVEGINDINFLKNMANVLIRSGKDVLDIEALENDGKIIFIPLGGSNLLLWTSRLKGLNRPEFHLYDRDDKPPTKSNHQDAADDLNNRGGNCKALITVKREMENYIHPDAIAQMDPQLTIPIGITWDFDDIPEIVAKQIHMNSGSPNHWDNLLEEKKEKKISRAKKRLNSQAVQFMTYELLNQIDPDGEVLNWFVEIKNLYEINDN